MARLRLFGGVTLEGAAGPLAGRAAQRRRLGLLAILAVSNRPVSRDKLIGYLWEESDTEHARKLLSESLYVIRKSLGEDALITLGDTVDLNRALIASDVADFMDALAHKEDQRAVDLYHGAFMDGFFINDAAEFDNWVEGERREFARLRAEALLRLAGAAEAAGDYSRAATLWRALTEQDPYSASYALGLMRSLEAAGDRPGALQHARVHAALLRSEFDAEPDQQVEAFRKVLLSAGPAATPTVERIVKTPLDATTSTPPALETSRRARSASPKRRWLWPAVFTVAIAAVAVVVAVLLMRRPTAPASTAPAQLVVVVPFTVHGPAAELGEGIVGLLSTDLDGAGDLRAADVHAVLSYSAAGAKSLLPRSAQRIAAHFGARYFVLGDIVQAGSQVQISATMYNAAAAAVARAATRGPADSLLVLVDQIATQLLSNRGVNPGELAQLAAYTTHSYPALKYYLEGDAHYRAARYRAAVSSFIKAIAADPAFALADYRLSAAAEWNFEFVQARAAARRALANSERLADHYRPLVRAWSYFLNGNAQAAQREYESVLSLYPNDVEARAGLGEVLVHFNPSRGLPITQARAAFERVLTLAPAYGEVRYHALEFAARDRNVARFDSLYQQLEPSNPQYQAWRAVRAFVFGNDTDRNSAVQRLSNADEMTIGISAARLAAHAHDFTGAARIARQLTTSNRTGQWRAGGYLLLAELAVAQADWPAVRAQLAAAAPLERDWPHELGALFALHPDALTDRAELLRIQQDLEAWRPDSHSPSLSFFLASHATIHKHLRLYLLGLVNVRLGDLSKAEAYRRELEQLSGDAGARALVVPLSRSLAGHIARARGDRGKAVELLESAQVVAPPEFLVSPFYSRAHDRLALGDLNRELGRTSEARRWYESLREGYDFPYAPAAEARLRSLTQ